MRVTTGFGHMLLALAAFATAGDAPSAESTCRSRLREGDWRRAEGPCREAYATNPDAGRLPLAQVEMNLGLEDEALALAREGLAGEARTDALALVGVLLDRRGDVEAARGALREARELSRARDDVAAASRASYALAGSYWRQANYRETIGELDASSRDAEASGDARMLGYVSLMRGDVMRAVGDAPLAEQAYHDADQRLKAPGDRAYLELKRGMLQRDAGRPALATRAFEAALDIGHRVGVRDVEGAAHLNLAYQAHLAGDPAAGLAHLDAWPAPDDVAYLYNRALLVADQGRFEEALRLLDSASRAADTDEWAWDVAYERGRLFARVGKAAEAERDYRTAIAVVERMREALDPSELQPWMLPRRRAPYEALFTLLARSGRAREALEALEAFTARSFLDWLAGGRARDGDAALDRADAVGALWRALRGRGPSADLGAALGRKEILVHVEAMDRFWVVHRAATGAVTIDDRAPAAEVVALAERFAADPDDASAAQTLGELLVPAAVVAGEPILHLVPTGDLLALPYAALRRGARRLVEERPLLVSPSLGAIAVAHRAPASTGSLVMADAEGDLPGARQEALDIARTLGLEAFVGLEATGARLAASPPLELLHIAGHAGVDAAGAWLSLADGPFSARDLLASRTHADVVVLAGCASAATPHAEMWGSLAAAFLANGSGTVIATLASVRDIDAAALVEHLYAHEVLADPSRSLRAAQRELLPTAPAAQWASFAAFGVSGE